MAKKKYKLSELGELGELVKNYKEKNSKKKETDSNNASIALSNSSSVQRYHNLGESLNNYLQNLQKSSGIISKNDYVNALNAQRKAIGAEVKSAVNSATSSRLPSEISDAERNAIVEATKIARFKESEKEEADKRAARQKSIENAKQNHPVVTDINPVSDWLNYIFESEQNYGRGGIENGAYSLNAFGAGASEVIKNAAKAISGDKEAQDVIKNDAKNTKDKIVAAFEKNRENPYGTPDEQLQEGEHLENLKKLWNKINPISNAAKAASVFNSTPYNKGFAEYKNTNTPEYQKDVIQKEIERTHPVQSAKPQYSPTQITKNLLTNTAYNMPAIAVSVASRGTAAAPYANYISGATLGIQSMSDSYDEAKKEGATDEEAAQYAVLEGVNQGVMDTVLGGVSGATGGLLDKPISNLASHIVRTPLAKTMVETGLDMFEEGMQESAQNYITTINKRVIYNPDAEFDVEGAVYEGVLGGLNSLVLSPGKAYSRYQVNKASYDTVNSLSIAANKVSSEQDAKVISDIADQISKGADEVIADSETETADKANAEYIKRGAEAVKKKLNENYANIVKNNQSVLEKTQEIIRTHKTSDAESLSELVNAVKESGYGGNSNNAVNNTVDYVNELITEQNQVAKTAESIASMQDSQISEDAQTAAVQKQKANEALEYTNTVIPQLKSISENLRSKRSEINARLKLDENTETMTNQNVKQEVNTQTTTTDTSASAKAEAQQAKTTTTERVSNSAYHSETAENIRSTYEGRNIKETAENIIKAHGNVRSAVDYIHDVYAKSGGSNADASTKEYIRALDSEIRKANKPLLEKNIKRVETLLKEYGVKNVEIDESITPLSDDGKSVWGMAHYNRGTGRIYVSPYADGKAIIGSKIVHEFTHHAAKADNSLVSDILKAASESKVFNKEIKLADGTTTTTIDNLTRLVKENYADEINEYIATSTNLSRYKVLVGMGKSEADAARIVADEFKASHAEEYNSIVDEYVNEDTAAYVMEFLNQEKNEDVLSQLIKDNRPLWKRILDKIEDFIAKITGKTEAREYQKAADKIREILGNEIDAKVENTGSFKAIQQQIKNGNSKIGNTSDGRKFSMEMNVDESNGLFAIHNLTADSFMKSYELGGFAMPSIAIARSDVGHSNFGDISLVFASDTINPANSDNKVYSADAWTPTFPRIEYEANSKVTDKLRDKYYELYGKFGHEKISALYPYGNYFEEQLNTDGGVDGIISKQSDNPQMMQVYLADTQGKTVDSVVKETKTTLPSEQVEQSEFIIDKLGADTVNEMRPQANESPISARKRWMSEHGDAFKAAYADYLMQSGLTSEEAQNAIDNMTKAQLLSQMVKARNYLANGAETVKSEVDTEATNNAIKEAVNQEDYLKWLHSLFDGGEKKSGVSNGKEPYTRNGNQRPFSATHYPVTLDNIVLSMKSQGDGNTKNATSIFVGSKTIRAESATEYSSLDEIRADKGRLAHRTPEEAKAAWNEFDNRLSAIINRIMDAESGIDNRFIEQDRIGSVLAEASRNNTEANIKKVLTQYKLTPAVAADFKALVDDIKSAPVDIFEAKPERVVGLDEVKYAIVPSDVNSDVTTALNNAGIETKTYENGNEADRLKVLNTLSDVRFSKQLDIDGKEFVKVNDTTIDEKNPKDIVKALKQIAESKGFYDMEINGQSIGLSNERGVKEWVYSKDAKSLYRSNQDAFNDKMQSFQNANELIEVAKSYINEEAVHKKKFDNFARGEVRFKVGDNGYIADILIGIRRNQSAELYDIVNITPTKITENSGRYVTDSTVQTRQEFSVDSSVPQTNSNVNTDAENSSNSSTDIRYSKELMTAEEKKKVREAERAAYLERQLVSTAPLGGKAKAVSPTAKAAVAKKIASGMPGVSTAQVNEQLTKFFEVIEHPKATTPAAYRDEVRQMANITAQNLYNEFRVENTNPLYDEFNDAYNHIKSLKFKMTDAVKDDFGKEAYSDFYKRARGTLKLRVNDGMAVDELWGDLCNLYPYFFSESTTNPSEMMEQIYEVQSSLKKTPGHPYYDMSSENTDIFSEGEDTATVNSIADALVAAYLENAKPTVAAENKSLRNENKRLAEEANAARGEAADAKTTLKVAMDWNQAELTKMYGDFTRQISEEQKQLQQANRKIERLTNKVERKNVNMAQKTALKEIGRLHEMFTNPTKQKHIPQNLRAAVGSYLTSLNNTRLLNGKTVNSQEITETLQSEQERINSAASKVINTLSGKFTTDSELYQGRSTRQIEALKFELDKLTELANESPNSGVDSSNNADYIRAVTDLTRMVNYLVKQSNDFFTGTRKVEAETFAKSWIDELSGHKTRIGETGFERSQFKKLLDGVGYSFMSADLFFSTMGEPGKEISSWYRNAQTRQVKMKQEYGEYMSELLGDNYSTIAGSTQAKKNLIDVKIHGNDVKVSKNQLMSLYLTWKRAAGRRHLENGGAAFTNANNETSKVYVIDEATYNTLMEKLTADDKRIADGIGKFLSENCSEWGNEASMQLYGIRLYEDSNYFPIRTPSELRDTNFSNLADTHTIENSSFTHKLNKNANAAVVIGDVFDIADRHVNDMSAYSAYAPLNNSMERAFNANGLKRALSSAYGNNGVKYMQDFIDKINGNEPKSTLAELTDKIPLWVPNNAKKAAVSANISTALKQPLSLVRSWLVIDPKYTLAAYAQITPGVNNIVKQGKEYNRILNTMNEYSGIAVIKSLGYSDTGIGTTTRETYDEQSLKSAYKKTKYIQQSAEDIAMRPAEFADEITWVRMWKACELEAKAKYGNTLSTDEFNRHVADKFNEIIGKTQVVDSVLDTAPISTNRLFKTLYPFMNEPVKTAATLISAAENVRNGKSGAKKQLTNAIGCYVISNLLLEPIVSSLVGMWRHDSPKDPEDFAKKFLERFIGIQADGETKWTDIFSSNVADGLFAVPYIAQIYDTIANKFNNFDPERMDLQPVADLVGNGMYFFNSLSKEDYENQKTKANYAADMIASLAQIFGIPGSTLKRDLSAIARTAVDATGAYVAQWELNKVYYNLGNANARANKNFYDIMAKAYNAGDTEAYSYMLRDLRSIQTGAKAFGVPYSNINKYITEHGAKIVEGTDMWYVSLQAEYDLNTFVPNMKVEKLVTSVYQKAKNEKLDNYENAIYKAPTTKANATFSVNKEDYEMTLEEFDDYIRNTGDFAYKITNALPSNYKWSSLNTAQQLYALEKTYEFSKAYWKKKLKPEYSAKSNWMDELCDNKVDFQTYARVIINQAKKYSPKD